MKRGRLMGEEGSWHLGKRRRHSEDETVRRRSEDETVIRGKHAFMRRGVGVKQEERSWPRRSKRDLELSGSEDETGRSQVRNVRGSSNEMVRRFPDEMMRRSPDEMVRGSPDDMVRRSADENGTEGEREDIGFLEGELDRRRIGESEDGRFRNILPSI